MVNLQERFTLGQKNTLECPAVYLLGAVELINVLRINKAISEITLKAGAEINCPPRISIIYGYGTWSSDLRKQQELKMSQKYAERNICT
jgi:hypothetical protein